MAKNVTLSIPEGMLRAGRDYAKKHHMSLNALIRNLLARVVMRSSSQAWLTECFRLMDQAKADSKGKRWDREDLYRG